MNEKSKAAPMIIFLIVSPLVVLMVAILAIGWIRAIRRVSLIRSQRIPLAIPVEYRKPSDDFHDQIWLPLCEKVAAAASQRLNRELTEKERRTIWRTRSELTLNVALAEIEQSADPQQVAVLLATLPPGMDRPDPTHWCEPPA